MHAVEKERTPRLSLGEERNIVTQILIVNLTVFILLLFTRVIYNMEGFTSARFNAEVLSWASLPADPEKLLVRPWTLITAMFSHISFWQVFSNMIWLWCFGTLLQNLAGYQRIFPLYLFGGLVGAAAYLLGMQVIPSFQALQPNAAMMGASASVMALAIGVTAIAPGYRIFPLLSGGIPLWVITLLYIALHITASVFSSTEHPLTHIPALAGGGLIGLLYMLQWKRGRDLGAGLNRLTYKATHVFHPVEEEHSDLSLLKKFNSPGGNAPYRRVGNVPEQRLNEILDKINELGISALTPEERETLIRASKDDC